MDGQPTRVLLNLKKKNHEWIIGRLKALLFILNFFFFLQYSLWEPDNSQNLDPDVNQNAYIWSMNTSGHIHEHIGSLACWARNTLLRKANWKPLKFSLISQARKWNCILEGMKRKFVNLKDLKDTDMVVNIVSPFNSLSVSHKSQVDLAEWKWASAKLTT